MSGPALIASRAEVVVHAVPATERAAGLLTIAKGEPLLQLDEMTFDQYDEPFETANLLNRGDRYAFATTLTRGRRVARARPLGDAGRARSGVRFDLP